MHGTNGNTNGIINNLKNITLLEYLVYVPYPEFVYCPI